MNGYNFTGSVRTALAAARDEASTLGHGYVGTEHILLGVLRAEDPVALAALRAVELDPGQLRRAVVAKIASPGTGRASGPDLPYTSRAKKVLEEAMGQARELNHGYVGPEHLLLGMLREREGVAGQVLVEAGTDLEHLKAEVVRVLSTDIGKQDRTTDGAHLAPQAPLLRTDAELRPGPSFALLVAVIALLVAITALLLAIRS